MADLSVLSTNNSSADTYKNRLAKLVVDSYSQKMLPQSPVVVNTVLFTSVLEFVSGTACFKHHVIIRFLRHKLKYFSWEHGGIYIWCDQHLTLSCDTLTW